MRGVESGDSCEVLYVGHHVLTLPAGGAFPGKNYIKKVGNAPIYYSLIHQEWCILRIRTLLLPSRAFFCPSSTYS